MRHVEQGRNVPMFRTAMDCRPAGVFAGPMVVSMRPVPAAQVATAVQVTARYPAVHGAPVHVGNPGALGIADLEFAITHEPGHMLITDVPDETYAA